MRDRAEDHILEKGLLLEASSLANVEAGESID